MDDNDLAKIRAARLQQLQSQSSPSGGIGGGSGSDEQAQEAESRKNLISQICTPEAADRLGRIRLVKESRAQDLENQLIALARSNQLRARVTDQELVRLIGLVDQSRSQAGDGGGGGGGSGDGGSEIVFQRRRALFDEDDDLFD